MVFNRCRQVTITCALASLLAATAAYAEPTAGDRETARALMAQGVELRTKGNLKEALKRFQAADEIMHVPSTELEVAKADIALGLLVEARDMIAAIRRTPVKPNEPTPFVEARTKADELDVSLNGRIPSLQISIKGALEGETPTVTVDNEVVPSSVLGLPRAVNPGHHALVVKTPGALGKQEIDLKEGETKPVELTLMPTGEPRGVGAPLKEAWKEPEAPPPPVQSHSPTVLTWSGVGVMGVGIAVGTVTGVLSLSKKSTLQKDCANKVCGPSSYSDYDAANSYATVSTVGFIAAGVGLAVAIVSLVAGHEEPGERAPAPAGPPGPPGGPSASPSPAASNVTFHPVIGLGGAGISGTF